MSLTSFCVDDARALLLSLMFYKVLGTSGGGDFLEQVGYYWWVPCPFLFPFVSWKPGSEGRSSPGLPQHFLLCHDWVTVVPAKHTDPLQLWLKQSFPSSKCSRGEFPLSSRLGGPTNTTDEQGPLQICGKVVFLYSFRRPCVLVFPLSSRLSAWASGEQRGRKFDLATFSILYCYNIQLLYFLNSKELREYNICMYMHLCIYMWKDVNVSVYVYICPYMNVCVFVCVSLCVLYVCMYVCLCIYVYMWICM